MSDQYKLFIFSSIFKSRRTCRCEIYLDGKLIKSMHAKDPQEARTVAARYLTSIHQSAGDDT
jgi:hypothetical protein